MGCVRVREGKGGRERSSRVGGCWGRLQLCVCVRGVVWCGGGAGEHPNRRGGSVVKRGGEGGGGQVRGARARRVSRLEASVVDANRLGDALRCNQDSRGVGAVPDGQVCPQVAFRARERPYVNVMDAEDVGDGAQLGLLRVRGGGLGSGVRVWGWRTANTAEVEHGVIPHSPRPFRFPRYRFASGAAVFFSGRRSGVAVCVGCSPAVRRCCIKDAVGVLARVGPGVNECRGLGVNGCRGPGVNGCRGPGVNGCRGPG